MNIPPVKPGASTVLHASFSFRLGQWKCDIHHKPGDSFRNRHCEWSFNLIFSARLHSGISVEHCSQPPYRRQRRQVAVIQRIRLRVAFLRLLPLVQALIYAP
jgi:hypothetical protein